MFVVYGLLIFEGALRRWVFPRYEYFIFFIRDPFVIWIYWLTLRHRMWPRGSPFLFIGMLFALVCIGLVYIQMLLGAYDLRHLLIAGYGWRNYFFYMPLAFIIAQHFTRSDLNRIIKFTLVIACFGAPLVALQFNSPATAVVNMGAALDEAHQFQSLGAAMGYVRPTGFFTSAAGQADFVASLVAMVLALWILLKEIRWVSRWLLYMATVSIFVMIAMSGSRSLVFHSGICILFSIAAIVVVRQTRVALRSVFIPVCVLFIFVSVYPVLFPTPYEVFLTRWIGAYASESQIYTYGIFGRAFYSLFHFVFLLPDVPFQGFLLGIGGNAATRLDWVDYPMVKNVPNFMGWIEPGLSRHIAELGPALGLLFVIYRWSFTLWLGKLALKKTRIFNDPLPLLLFAFVAPLLFWHQITGHGTHNGYVWLFVGFCLVACKPGDHPSKALHSGFGKQRRVPYSEPQ